MNINEIDFVSYFLLVSFLTAGIYVKYFIDPHRLYKILEVWNFMCENNPTILNYLDTKESIEQIVNEQNDTVTGKEQKLQTKYENTYHEKYLEKFKTFPNVCNFTEEENELYENFKVQFKNSLIDQYNQELKTINHSLNDIQLIIAAGGLNTQEGVCLLLSYYKIEEEFNEDPDEVDLNECWTDLLVEKGSKEIRLSELKLMSETYNQTDEEIYQKAYRMVLQKHLQKCMDNYILEFTPLGNVYMRYNVSKDAFEYYSDSTLPYRYLETVARKYVITYWCKPIYIDIEEELKKASTAQTIDTTQKQPKQTFSKETLEIMNKIKAKGTNMALPTQVQANLPSIQNSNSEKHLLKEKANRYTWEGRLHDFCPLKKIDRKVVDKRLNMTFAEFKKMLNQNKK